MSQGSLSDSTCVGCMHGVGIIALERNRRKPKIRLFLKSVACTLTKNPSSAL